MQHCKQSSTAFEMIFTLNEFLTISNAYFLFVFTHSTTKEKVKFIKSVTDDESSHPDRYNMFTIDVSAVFNGSTIGDWNYVIYEQVSNSNTDETLTGSPLEYGKLRIERSTEFEFVVPVSTTSYKVYNGQ